MHASISGQLGACQGIDEALRLCRHEKGFQGSIVWQKLRYFSFTRMLGPDTMHTIAGEVRRIFLMLLGMRIDQAIANLEVQLGK